MHPGVPEDVLKGAEIGLLVLELDGEEIEYAIEIGHDLFEGRDLFEGLLGDLGLGDDELAHLADVEADLSWALDGCELLRIPIDDRKEFEFEGVADDLDLSHAIAERAIVVEVAYEELHKVIIQLRTALLTEKVVKQEGVHVHEFLLIEDVHEGEIRFII
jgi:hypothetical protein